MMQQNELVRHYIEFGEVALALNPEQITEPFAAPHFGAARLSVLTIHHDAELPELAEVEIKKTDNNPH